MAQLWQKLQKMFLGFSGPMRMLVVIALVLIALLGYVEVILEPARDLSARADRYEQQIREAETTTRLERIHELNDAIITIGDIELPTSESDGRRRMNDAIAELDRTFSLSDLRISPRQPANLSLREGAPSVRLTQGMQLAQISADIGFEARQEDVIRAISYLESHPAIHRVSQVRINRHAPSQRVRVSLTMETWILTQRTATGGGII